VAVTPPASIAMAAERVESVASCSTAICSGDIRGEYEKPAATYYLLLRR
jgi:hypothetical protein